MFKVEIMQTEIEVEFKKIIFQTDNFGIFALGNGLSAKGNLIHSATSLLNTPMNSDIICHLIARGCKLDICGKNDRMFTDKLY